MTFQRFDADARAVWILAGEIAVRRLRQRRGLPATEHVVGVSIKLADVRVALSLLRPKGGWQGGMDRHVERRLKTLPKKGTISAADLEEAVR